MQTSNESTELIRILTGTQMTPIGKLQKLNPVQISGKYAN